ncbi:thymidine kinase [uncultured Prevotella sp.]|uniref:thymidine kinase n=1 Tax=uncultured Prevotella sp. TaxID=159272 RepID=UPI0027E2D5F1|nr:thymidine kinase [uncultured Prevotella sp.]
MTAYLVGEKHRQGRIEVICGSMFSGKTEELIRRMKRATFARQRVVIFKPQLDKRYSEANVVSHDRNEIPSTPIAKASDIITSLARTKDGEFDIDVVGIDEAQFFDMRLVDVCNELAGSNVRVIIAGLDMDFKGIPFGPIPSLCAVADDVTKVHAICVKCGSLAYVSHRLVHDDNRVLIGEQTEYEPLCRECYNKLKD